MSTLLEKALAVSPGSRISKSGTLEERFELAYAYATRQISGKQLCVALGKNPRQCGNVYNFVATALSDAIRTGLLVKANDQTKGEL